MLDAEPAFEAILFIRREKGRELTANHQLPRTFHGGALSLALCAALASTGCASLTHSEKAATVCMAADLVTTAWGMSEGHAENNPTVSELDDWQIVATNAALHWGLWKLTKRVPPKKAATFWSSYAAVRCGAALHNYGVIDAGRESDAVTQRP